MENLDVMRHARKYNEFLFAQIEAAATCLPAGAVCLDHGAGVGRFLGIAQSRFAKSYAVEIDAHYRVILANMGAVVFSNLDAIPDNSVDVAWSFNVLEHIEDDQKTLRQLVSKLKPAGRLILFVPAFNCLYSKMDERVGHVRRYTVEELYQKTTIAGAIVETAHYADSLGFLAAGVYRLLGGSGLLTEKSVKFYDRAIFPLSEKFDGLTSSRFGKNVLVHAVKPMMAV